MTRDEINSHTGFDDGAPFEDANDVRAYFTVENMRWMFGGGVCLDPDPDSLALTQGELEQMAETVIDNRWNFGGAK